MRNNNLFENDCTGKAEILRKMNDVYQTEIETYGFASFDIYKLENMNLEELEAFASDY